MNDPPETTNAEMLSALTNAMTQFASAREPRKSLGDCRKAATSLELKFTGLPISKRGSMWREFEKKLFGLGNEFKWMKPIFKMVQGINLDEGETIVPEDDELLVALLKYIVHPPALDKLTLAEDRDRAAGLPPSAVSLLIEVQKWALPKTRGDMWQNIVTGLTADSMPSKADPTTYLANMNQNMTNLRVEYGLVVPVAICVAFAMVTLPASYSQMHYDIAKQSSSISYSFEQLSVDIQSHWASFLRTSAEPVDTEAPTTEIGKMLAAIDELQTKVDAFHEKGKPKTNPPRKERKHCDNCGMIGHVQATCWQEGGGDYREGGGDHMPKVALAIQQLNEPDQNDGAYFGLAAVTYADKNPSAVKPLQPLNIHVPARGFGVELPDDIARLMDSLAPVEAMDLGDAYMEAVWSGADVTEFHNMAAAGLRHEPHLRGFQAAAPAGAGPGGRGMFASPAARRATTLQPLAPLGVRDAKGPLILTEPELTSSPGSITGLVSLDHDPGWSSDELQRTASTLRGDSPSAETRSGTSTRPSPGVATMSLNVDTDISEMYVTLSNCHEASHLAGQPVATHAEPTVRIDQRTTAHAVEFQKVSPPNAIWDTGASMHMFTNINYFSEFNANNTTAWHTAGDGVVRSSGTGTVPYRFYNQTSGEYATLELRASLMEHSSFNLISAGLLEDEQGLYASIDKEGGMLFHDDKHTQVNLRKVDGVYRITEHNPGDQPTDDAS